VRVGQDRGSPARGRIGLPSCHMVCRAGGNWSGGERVLVVRPGNPAVVIRKTRKAVRVKEPGGRTFIPTQAQRDIVSVLASIPRPYEVIRSLIINPATGKPIEEMTLMKHFEKELHQAQGSVDLLCAKSIKNKIKEGDNFAIGLWARNKFGWDRPGRTIERRCRTQTATSATTTRSS